MEIDIHEYEMDYHRSQFLETKRSTIAFGDYLEKNLIKDTSSILDIGSGMGAVLYYLESRWKHLKLLGIDNDIELINFGNKILKKLDSNVKLQYGDIYKPDISLKNKFDGIISTQTLSWLSDYETPLKSLLEFNPKWIGITSLFYDGPVSCDIYIKEFFGKRKREHIYRIYSIDLVKKLLIDNGYKNIQVIPFDIDIDISRPDDKLMRTYTKKMQDGKRLQISGPILMPWYFIFANKK